MGIAVYIRQKFNMCNLSRSAVEWRIQQRKNDCADISNMQAVSIPVSLSALRMPQLLLKLF